MRGPALERRSLFGLVCCFVVDAGDAALVAADVVQARFDDVRLDADLGGVGREAAAQIVRRPVRQASPCNFGNALVERRRAVTPPVVSALAGRRSGRGLRGVAAWR